MMVLITGGSGSGKSQLAEKICMQLGKIRYYIATMQVYDAECRIRIERHRKQRNGMGFITIEAPRQLTQHLQTMQPDGTALLECVGNLTANEQFDGKCSNVTKAVVDEICAVNQYLKNLVVVTNEVCCDILPTDKDTLAYLQHIGAINCQLAQCADVVIEAVCGQAVFWKGTQRHLEETVL